LTARGARTFTAQALFSSWVYTGHLYAARITAGEFNRSGGCAMLATLKSAFSQFSRFAHNRGGNVAMTFALATIPVIGSVGAAIDFSHANSVKTAMQTALDSTALMISRDAATVSSSQLETNATNYFNALFTRPEVTNVQVSAAYTTDGGSQVALTASGRVPTAFVGILGMETIPVTASSTAKWGSNRLRVALVLDNTGSMAQSGKMTALQTATKNLLTQLQNAASVDGDVYVSIVPFVKDVNVGTSNKSATWIDWSQFGQCKNYNGWTQPTTKSACKAASGTWSSLSKSNWQGCVMDRGDTTGPNAGNYDTNVTAPSTKTTATLFPAENYSACPSAAVMPLSYNWSGMSNLVDAMSPNGSTNQNIGLQLGWMSLTGGGPFPTPAAEDANYQYSHIIILLTDGLNTQDRWYGDGSSLGTSDDAKIDARQELTCANFKNASQNNIIYTIQVNTDGEPTSTLLQNCASTSDKFYLLTSADQILTTFNEIGSNLTKLRVAK
jgi:Flp pilus assembly protein TadG